MENGFFPAVSIFVCSLAYIELLTDVSRQKFVPNAVITLTYDAKVSDTLDDTKRFLRKMAKSLGQHLFCEIHWGLQHKRSAKSYENKNHFHCIVSFEYPEFIELKDDKDVFIFEKKLEGLTEGVRVDYAQYVWSPKEVRYFFLKHKEHYAPYVICPRKGRCRRKGCPFSDGRIDWTLLRPVF
jgi:hypothetical protein